MTRAGGAIVASDVERILSVSAYGQPTFSARDELWGWSRSLFEALGLEPTYYSLGTPGSSGKYQRWPARGPRRELDRLSRSDDFALIYCETDAPSYDALLNCSWCTLRDEQLFFVVLNKCFDVEARELLQQIAATGPWDAGYAFATHAGSQVECYALTCGTGRNPPEDEAKLIAWYNADVDTRKTILRDVLPFTLVTGRHLAAVPKGTPLSDVIARHGAFTRCFSDTLHLWEVPFEDLPQAEQELKSLGLLVR